MKLSVPKRGGTRLARALPGASGRGPLPLALGVYAAVALVAVGSAAARGVSPLTSEGWFGPPSLAGHGLSLLGGAALALGTTWATRVFVRRFRWAKALHGVLRPGVRHAGDAAIVVLGIASAAAEELFFRGLLATTLGLVASSMAFGLLHQVRGRGRWAWSSWAAVMGLLFGALFFATGSLLGPIAAHAAINVANLRFLRDTDVAPPKARRLGGLLGRA
jgi:uncharacterized protein